MYLKYMIAYDNQSCRTQNSSLPLRQVALKFCLPWFALLMNRFSWQTTFHDPLHIWQVKLKSYFAQKENLVVPDHWTAFFSSPAEILHIVLYN